jgi:hypothetical protein
VRLQQVAEGFLSPYEVQKREEAALRREAELLQTLNNVEEELTKVGPGFVDGSCQILSCDPNDSKGKEAESTPWAGTGFDRGGLKSWAPLGANSEVTSSLSCLLCM